MAPEVARARDQGYLLQETIDSHYSKPGMAWIGHVYADYAARNFSLMRVTPRDAPRTDVGVELDEALSSKVIEVKLQAVLKADSMSRTRHCCTRPIFVGAHVTDSLHKV